MIRGDPHGFIKGKSCLVNLKAIHDEITACMSASKLLSIHLVVRETFFIDTFMHHKKKKGSKMPCAALFIVMNNEKLRAIQCEETM